MRISSIITGILASSAFSAGCTETYTTGECDPSSTQTTYADDFEQSSAEAILDTELTLGHELSAADCSALCTVMTGEDVISIDACTASWNDVDGEASSDTGAGSDTGGLEEEGSIYVECTATVPLYCMGRRPIGHEEARVDSVDPVACFFAEAGHLEAAAVIAFRQLASQLEQLGAPIEFVDRCRAAACDEVRHARDMARLARRAGTRVPPVKSVVEISSDLFSLALHNAVEGCVNETWAAMLAGIQAQRAETPHLRSVFQQIAVDEIRHGQLAWDLHRWFMGRLDAKHRMQIREAQQQALRKLPEVAGVQLAALPSRLGGGSVTLGQTLGHRLASALAA